MIAGKGSIPAPHGQLESLYRAPEGELAGAALVLHPHPLYGGTMHNPVVYHCARALLAAGFVTLRFNFRGVGESSGEHGGGVGELEDARIALAELRRRCPDARRLVVAGYSFGAAVGARLAVAEASVTALAAIALPAQMLAPDALQSFARPILLLHGEHDDVAPTAKVAELARALPRAELYIVPGADHFFASQGDEIESAIGDWARRLAEG